MKMPEYFRTTRRNRPKRGEWAEKLWEITPIGAITRTVEVDDYGNSRALSLQIMAHKSSAFADYAERSAVRCLTKNHYASIAEWKDAMKDQGFQVQPTTKANFERRFMTSNPDL
ncbi:MAG: hypothetical protein AAGJ85_05355 [Pseudomonadota bacterium]